jgi:hypothetical protein
MVFCNLSSNIVQTPFGAHLIKKKNHLDLVWWPLGSSAKTKNNLVATKSIKVLKIND